MTSRRHLTLVAAASTLLGAAPIATVFDSLNWLFRAIITVAMIAGAGYGMRAMRSRIWAQALAMVAALLVALTLFSGGGTALLGLIPTPETLEHFRTLVSTAGSDIQTAYVPAPDIESLLFLTNLGVGIVAILVDIFAVGLRRPALAGLPMLAIYSVPVAVYADSVSSIPFIIAATGYLWLLVTDNVDKVRRFGRRFTGEGRGVDIWEPSPLAAAGRRLAVLGVVAAVILPIAVPGMTAGFFSQFGTTGQGPGSGLGPGQGGSSVNLFAHLYGELSQSQVRELVKVTTNDPNPYYLRFGIADDIQPDGFRNRAPSGRPVGNDLPRPIGLSAPGVTTQQFTAKVEVYKTFDMPLVPVYSAPISTKGLDQAWNYDVDQQVIFSGKARSVGRKYDFDFVRAEFTPELLRTAKALPPTNKIQSTLTRVPLDIPDVQNLVDELTADKPTVYDQVRALYDYFSVKNNFAYDLTVPEGSSGQKITDFLAARRGFCQQYAAALAWMVRAAGIPARVAFGFTRGSTYAGGVYTLTNKNLHAWTEVYFDGFGWVPFDATPSASVAGSVNTGWAPNVDAPPDQTPTGGPSLGPTASPDSDIDPRNNVDECPECALPSGPAITRTPAWVWWTLAATVAALLLLIAPALRRQAVRRRRRRTFATATVQSDVDTGPGVMASAESDHDSAKLQAHAAWDELIDTMVDYRIFIDAAETPRTTAERLVSKETLAGSAADQARLLGQAEERARYSKRPLTAQGLMEAVADVRRTLASQATRWVRLTAVVLPPSVVQRWRNRVSTAGLRTSQRLTDANMALRRLSRPLRLRRTSR